MRVAVVQMSVDAQSRANNQRRACELLVRAAEEELAPEVICLPARCEGALADHADSLSSTVSESFVEVRAAQAREMGGSRVTGFTEHGGDRRYDCAAWYDADGDMLIKHRKIMVAREDSTHYGKGQTVGVAHSIFGPVGVVVGEDVCSESIVATVKLMGARIIFAPCCWNTDRQGEQLCALASEAGMWIVIVNSVGDGGGNGLSTIIDHTGQVVCTADGDAEQIIAHDIDLENSAS